ncbi:MAG TPA: zinc-dependent metalloprotease [Myxococcaceae bacterium]|nr:zinc-dependent metalloprotease [Myxococcaceae bacterium]
MFKKAFLAVSCGTMLFGCGVADPQVEIDEIKSNLIKAGYQADDITLVDGKVMVQDDAHVTVEASREMIQVKPGQEQYRTNNLVSTSLRKICINPTSTFNSYARLSQGLDAAISNYNALGLTFYMARGPGLSGCEANITAQTTTGTGGSAGFPSNGKPYGTINIGTGLNSYSVDVNEHVITHELGHCIGFRHTDYYNRAISCGSGGNEGDAGVGAVHIPGTPTTATVGGSIMNACFRSTESGEFTSSDVTALNYLY